MNEKIDRSKVKERYAAGKMRQHATRTLFFIGGFGAASWAPLVLLLRERLAIGEDVLGMLLLCIGIGSLLTMPLAGAAAVRFGCRKTLSAAMLLMRFLGDATVQKLGQKVVVLGGSLLAFLGFLLVIFAPGRLLLYAGFFAIGIGSANIVPVFFSLLGKQQDMPISMAVPAVSSLGYLGILMGPAAIGFLAHQTSLYAAFGLLASLVAVQSLIAAYVYKKVL